MTDKAVINKKISPVVIVFLGLLAAIAPLSVDKGAMAANNPRNTITTGEIFLLITALSVIYY